jgi:hypothetical protein
VPWQELLLLRVHIAERSQQSWRVLLCHIDAQDQLRQPAMAPADSSSRGLAYQLAFQLSERVAAEQLGMQVQQLLCAAAVQVALGWVLA